MKPSLVIVGLGNPGKQYEKTRHNAGFMALDVLHEKIGAGQPTSAFGGLRSAGEWKPKQKFLADIAEGTLDGKTILLVKPTTFMNDSGNCIRKLVDFYKLDPTKELLVVTDDIDLPLGTFRFRKEGGPGTHNGLKSIVATLGEGFPRHRIGIGPKPEGVDLSAWVLSRMNDEEIATMSQAMAALEGSAKDSRVLKRIRTRR